MKYRRQAFAGPGIACLALRSLGNATRHALSRMSSIKELQFLQTTRTGRSRTIVRSFQLRLLTANEIALSSCRSLAEHGDTLLAKGSDLIGEWQSGSRFTRARTQHSFAGLKKLGTIAAKLSPSSCSADERRARRGQTRLAYKDFRRPTRSCAKLSASWRSDCVNGGPIAAIGTEPNAAQLTNLRSMSARREQP